MGWFKKNTEQIQLNNDPSLNWIIIKNIEQAKSYFDNNDTFVVIFKHSTRCSISSMALSRFEREWNLNDQEVIPLYLDIIAYRDVSDYISTQLNVVHQSPQVLLVKNGKCLFNASHNAINVSHIASRIAVL